MSRSLFAAILGAALFAGATAIGTTGAAAAPLTGVAGYDVGSQVETVQYRRERPRRRCRWVKRRVRSSYGWRTKRVRVCTPRRRRRDY